MFEVISTEIRSRCPEELPDVDDLTLVGETLEGLKERREHWKGSSASKINVEIGVENKF